MRYIVDTTERIVTLIVDPDNSADEKLAQKIENIFTKQNYNVSRMNGLLNVSIQPDPLSFPSTSSGSATTSYRFTTLNTNTIEVKDPSMYTYTKITTD